VRSGTRPGSLDFLVLTLIAIVRKNARPELRLQEQTGNLLGDARWRRENRRLTLMRFPDICVPKSKNPMQIRTKNTPISRANIRSILMPSAISVLRGCHLPPKEGNKIDRPVHTGWARV
jgi:hypothetical protein